MSSCSLTPCSKHLPGLIQKDEYPDFRAVNAKTLRNAQYSSILYCGCFKIPHWKPCGLKANGEASDDHEDAGEEEDEDEEDGAALHCDPVLDEKGEDVREFWNCAGPV